MPTDLSNVLARRRAERLNLDRTQMLVLIAPVVFGLVTMILAARIPALAAALVLVGLE